MSLEKSMQNVQDGWQKMFDNFKGFSDATQSILLVDKIADELLYDNTIAGIGIKEAIRQNKPCKLILDTCYQQLQDGWKGLSGNLTKEIKALYEKEK